MKYLLDFFIESKNILHSEFVSALVLSIFGVTCNEFFLFFFDFSYFTRKH